MNTLLKKILVLAVMLGTYTSYANDEVKVNTTFNYVEKGNLISVSDASGEVIYSGEINYNGNLTTLFDFTQLNDGEYVVEISKDFEIKINTITVKNHIVTVLNTNNKTIHKPLVRNENAKVYISKLALDTNQMKIKLYFEGELINSETVKGGDILNRIYKLDEALKGNYSVIIEADSRVFIDNFRI